MNYRCTEITDQNEEIFERLKDALEYHDSFEFEPNSVVQFGDSSYIVSESGSIDQEVYYILQHIDTLDFILVKESLL